MNTVLVIEDTQDNFDLLADALEGRCQLIHACSGAEGLSLARSDRPDLILLDMSLLEMDGWEVTRCLKADPLLKHVPIIALTAHAMNGDREQCLLAGCNDYRAKPIDVGEFRTLVHDLLNPQELVGLA